MSDKPFETEINIKRESGCYMLPAGLTNEASKVLKQAVDSFGHIVNHDTTINNNQFANKIIEHSSNQKSKLLSENLSYMSSLTFVVFNGDHRDSKNVDYKYNVIGANNDDAEKLIDLISDNEINKKQYQDNQLRRISVFTQAGGELKSGLFQKERPENKNKVKPT
jgi:hypothetical protein